MCNIDWQKPLIARYRIYPGQDWGSAPQVVKDWFNHRNLFTTSNPIYGDPCFWWPIQRVWYGIGYQNWGSAPQSVINYLLANHSTIQANCLDTPSPYL